MRIDGWSQRMRPYGSALTPSHSPSEPAALIHAKTTPTALSPLYSSLSQLPSASQPLVQRTMEEEHLWNSQALPCRWSCSYWWTESVEPHRRTRLHAMVFYRLSSQTIAYKLNIYQINEALVSKRDSFKNITKLSHSGHFSSSEWLYNSECVFKL